MTIDLISERTRGHWLWFAGGAGIEPLLTLFTAPIIYLYLDRLQSRPAGRRY